MPSLRRKADPSLHADPADWRPQAYGRKGPRVIGDAIIEPKWGGVRVIVRVGPGSGGSRTVSVSDEDGFDATEEFADLARAIAAAALSDDLVVDGYFTVEPTQETVGADMTVVETPTQGQLIAQLVAGSRGRPREAKRKLDPDRPIAFVAVDLLWVDGSSLIELPLLERKRLLDAALTVNNLVRITPYVRPPIGSLAITWHAQGFREVAFKPANGRYHPTGEPGDWAVAPIRSR